MNQACHHQSQKATSERRTIARFGISQRHSEQCAQRKVDTRKNADKGTFEMHIKYQNRSINHKC
jgi:hypothetical protein